MNARLLMIEDDDRLASMVGDYLRQSGFAFAHAGDGQSGLTYVQHNPVDLVILDLMLPDMDGLQVCQKIRAMPGANGQMPVLMLTAKGDPMDRIIGLELGADDYLPKPFEPRELLARIRAIFRRKSALSNCLKSQPSTNTAPSVGTLRPCISLDTVVLPDPTRPKMATFSPALIVKEPLSRPPDCWPGY